MAPYYPLQGATASPAAVIVTLPPLVSPHNCFTF